MPDRQVKIIFSPEDAGVATTASRIGKQLDDVFAKGGDRSVIFSAEFHEAQVQQRVADFAAKAQAEADKHQIALEAKMVEREARDRYFGPEKHERAETRDTGMYFGPAAKERFGRDEKAIRDTMATRIREMRDATRQMQIETSAQERLFGSQEKAPRTGPLRNRQATNAEDQAWRDSMAESRRVQRQANNEARLGVGGDSGGRRLGGAIDGEQLGRGAREAGEHAGREAGHGFEQQMKAITGKKGFLKESFELATGGGAWAGLTFVIGEVSEAAEKAGELVKQFNEGKITARDMASEVAHSIPIIGQAATMFERIGGLIKESGKGIANWFAGKTGLSEAAIKEQTKENRETGAKMREERDKRRGEILGAIDQQAEAAGDSDSLRGHTGDDLEIQRASVELRKKLAEADKLAREKGSLGGDQQVEAEKKIQSIRNAAYADFYAKQDELRKNATEKAQDTLAESNAKTVAMDGETETIRLRMKGEGFAAELAQLKSAHDGRLAELDRQRVKDEKQFGGEVADQNYQSQKKSLDEKFAADSANVIEKNQREQMDQSRSFAKQMLDLESSTAQTRLKAAGQDYQAGRLAAKQALADQLQDVRDNLDKQLREHAERAPELRKQAAAAASGAKDQNDAQLEALARERFKPTSSVIQSQDAGLLTGVADQALNQDRANQLAAMRDTVRNTAKTNDKLDKVIQMMTSYFANQSAGQSGQPGLP